MASPTTQKRLKQGPSGVISCLAYSACSISMVLGNKALATYGVDVHLLPVVFQCFFAMVMTKLLSAVGIPGLHAEAMNLKTAVSWLPINVLFCSMLFTSFMALKWIEIPMFQVFKTSTVVWVTILEFLLFGGKVNAHCCAALTLIVVGAAGTVVTGIDLRNGWGLFWMVANVFSTASYIIYLKFATRFIKLSRLGMVKYNNTLGVLLLAPAVLAKGEVSSLLESGALKSWQYVGLNLLVGVVGFGINLVALWCIECTSASTYSITGNLSKIPSTIIGRFMFVGRSVSNNNSVCVGISLLGGVLYAAAKTLAPTQHSGKEAKMLEQIESDDEEVTVPLTVVASETNSSDVEAGCFSRSGECDTNEVKQATSSCAVTAEEDVNNPILQPPGDIVRVKLLALSVYLRQLPRKG